MDKFYTATPTELFNFYQTYIMVEDTSYEGTDPHGRFALLMGIDRQSARKLCYKIGYSLSRSPVVKGFFENLPEENYQ
jgi:hypothetical protein